LGPNKTKARSGGTIIVEPLNLEWSSTKLNFFAIKATHCVYVMCHLNADMHIMEYRVWNI